MNKKTYSLLILLGPLCMFSCQKSLDTWSGVSSIYFPASFLVNAVPATDSLDASFAFLPTATKELTVSIPVKVSGAPANNDRTYTVTALDSSSAKPGIHYTILNSPCTMKAGMIVDTIKIKFLRTADMQTKRIPLYLQLNSDANFTPNITDLLDATGAITAHRSWIKVIISDILIQPKYWSTAYYGTFSRKKLLLICNLNTIDPNYYNTPPPNNSLITYSGKLTQRWLNDQKAAGNIIYEDDGVTPMIMGASSQ